MNEVIKVHHLTKKYLLGQTHTDLLSEKISNGLRGIYRRLTSKKIGKSENTTNCQVKREISALKDVNFEVQQGDVIGVIGCNGAGKSTLLKVLSRITSPTSGEVEIHGRIASLLEVGTGFHPELTGKENIYLNGAILGMNRRETKKKFDEIISFAEIEKFINTPVKRYSSGMYVRLAFSVAAHLNPDILLIDEVLAVGDLAFQRKCLNTIDKAAHQGRTVLFVSHNMASIKNICKSVLYLKNGQVDSLGHVDAIIERYLGETVPVEAILEFPDQYHYRQSGLQIRKAEVLNQAYQHTSIIRYGEDFHIRLSIQTIEQVKGARVGFGLCTNGVRLATIHTDPLDFPVDSSLWRLTCRIKGAILLPGFYELQLGAHSIETGKELDWVSEPVNFRIAYFTKNDIYSYDAKEKGLVKLNVKWEGDLIG